MDLTPDQVTELIVAAFQKGVAHGRTLAEAEDGPQVFVRPGRMNFGVDPTVAPFAKADDPVKCTHERTTQARSNVPGETWGPKQCMDCGEVL